MKNKFRYLIDNENVIEIIRSLKNLYKAGGSLNSEEVQAFMDWKTYNNTIIGLIGLLTQSKAKILIGKKNYDFEVQTWCEQVDITHNDLENIAMDYLDENFEDEPEYILREVMLLYPKQN